MTMRLSLTVLALLLTLPGGGCSTRVRVLFQRPSTEGDAGPGDAGMLDAGPTAMDAARMDASLPTPSGAFDVAAGRYHTCALMGGPLYCWGENGSGQLGLGDNVTRTAPTRVGERVDFTQVSLGDAFSCALTRGGEVLCTGDNSSGQLGLGDRRTRSSLSPVTLPLPARSVHAGYDHACAILSSNAVYCWGQNVEGQLAQGDPFPSDGENRPAPVALAGARAVAMDAGQGHACLVDPMQQLYCWGRNSESQLGVVGAPGQVREPLLVQGNTRQASAAMMHTCLVDVAEALHCWGENTEGQLGVGDRSARATPTPVPGDLRVAQLDTSTFTTCAVTVFGGVYCFGRNVEGQLGLGDKTDRLLPDEVPIDDRVLKVATGPFHTCIQLESGTVLCTGDNAHGAVGLADEPLSEVFVPVLLLEGAE